MFIIIAGQVGTIVNDERGAHALADLGARFGADYPLAPDRTTAGDVHALTPGASAALETVLHLMREPHWRVGLGIGHVHSPLPASIREAHGDGVDAARDAIQAATSRPSRFAMRGGEGESSNPEGYAPNDTHRDTRGLLGARRPFETIEPLIDLLLAHRARWSMQSWELHDLLAGGGTQAEAAQRLGITPQAASKRARTAGLRIDADARWALSQLLTELA